MKQPCCSPLVLWFCLWVCLCFYLSFYLFPNHNQKPIIIWIEFSANNYCRLDVGGHKSKQIDRNVIICNIYHSRFSAHLLMRRENFKQTTEILLL